jgi:gliding motility-associated-like protein
MVDTQLTVFFTVHPPELCMGQEVTIRHQLHDSSVQHLNWQYGDGNYAALQDSIQQHAYDQSGTMYIMLKATYRVCPQSVYSDSVTIHPIPVVDLGIDSVLCFKNSPVTIQNRHLSEDYQYLWSTGATASSIAITQPGTYWLRVANSFGCTAQENIKIAKGCYTDIPNAFTPNGDGINDYFFPRQLLTQDMTRFHMQVFNRWGQLLFATANPEGRGWDGRFNGSIQPAGVYLYTIIAGFTNGTEEKYEGHVTLIR